jgi:hypothetical protein
MTVVDYIHDTFHPPHKSAKNTTKHNNNNIDLAYSEKMSVPETLLTGWFNLSAIVTASSLIFYNMARKSSLTVHPSLAKFISIGLILISTLYMIFSLGPYYHRMRYLAKKCDHLHKCDTEQVEHINKITDVYLLFGAITAIIQLLITYLIIVTV